MSYLFSFKGRINRAKVWLFLLICIVVDIAMIAIAAFGFDWSETLRSLCAQMKGAGHIDFRNVAGPKLAGPQSYLAIAGMALLYAACLYAALAIYTKRLHDRNKSAWWLIPFYILPVALGIYYVAAAPSVGHAMSGYSTVLGYAADGIGSLVSFWAFVVLFLFPGTAGDNRYGPDPLAKKRK